MKAFLPNILFLWLGMTSLLLGQSKEVDDILKRINALRKEHDLPLLFQDVCLSQSAATYSLELSELGGLTHKQDVGQDLRDRYGKAEGTGVSVGEILGTKSAGTPLSDLWNAWLSSESHLRQILNPIWYRVGIGKATKEGIDIYVIQFSLSSIEGYDVQKKSEDQMQVTISPDKRRKSLRIREAFSRTEKKGDELGPIHLSYPWGVVLIEIWDGTILTDRFIIDPKRYREEAESESPTFPGEPPGKD